MKKYEGYLLCTDFDGTFALPGAQLSDENIKAVKHFQQNGGLFTIASGRSPSFIRDFRDSFVPNAPVIAANGTMICDQNDYSLLKGYPLDRSVLASLDDMAQSGLCRVILLWTDTTEFKTRIEWTPDSPALPSVLFENTPGTWYKALFVQESAEKALAVQDLFLSRYGDKFSGERSWPEGFEIHSKGSGKGECVRWLKEWYGGRVHTTVGAGDFDNDISLVSCSDIGYAVANATEAVKTAANRHTVPHTEHAIARIIEELG